jgi:hypothetical protein
MGRITTLGLAFVLLFSGCVDVPYITPVPVTPPAPLPPAPPVSGAVPYEVVQQIEAGMSEGALTILIGKNPEKSQSLPGGEKDLGWEAIDSRGGRRLLVVRISAEGAVVSRALF